MSLSGDRYHFFISYAQDDRPWVHGFLVDALEAAGLHILTEENFTPGVPPLLELERAVKQSNHILLVLSPAYHSDRSAEFIRALAQTYGQEQVTWPVIPLILRPTLMPPGLAFLKPLDATNLRQWSELVATLCDLARRPPPGPAPRPPCPYPGMLPFTEEDAAQFFGREHEVDDLVRRLRLHPFQAVIGPSGGGKSSLVYAGALPRLRTTELFGPGTWIGRWLRPGDHPLAALIAALGGDPAAPQEAVARHLAATPGATRFLLIVDQFEELFTVGKEEQTEFERGLQAFAQTPHCFLILTARADFYPEIMNSSLWPAIKEHRVEVLPLTEDGLRQAIVRPAEATDVFIDPALVERLLADAAGEPGVLPLIQETLVLLWEKLERRYLPLRAYEALAGSQSTASSHGSAQLTGLQVAMASRADAAVAGLPPERQAIARRIFLRLVQFGEGRADTRRQQAVAKLQATTDQPGQFEATLRHLAAERLLTMSGGEGSARLVDLAHEALIGGWPTLQGWISERRDAEQSRRRLEIKAAEWVRLGRGRGGLLDAAELPEAERWLNSVDAVDLGYDGDLAALAEASRVAIEAAEQEREATHQRELMQTQALADERQRRIEVQARTAQRLRGGAALLAALAVVAVVAAVLAIGQSRKAVQEKDAARRAADVATAGRLAAQSEAELAAHPQLSLLLAVESLRATQDSEQERVPTAEEALRGALANVGGRGLGGQTASTDTFPGTHIGPVFSKDGHWLATGGNDGLVRLWDLMAQSPADTPHLLPNGSGDISALAFSPDGRWLASGRTDGAVRVWDLRSLQSNVLSPALLDSGHLVELLAFSPNGHRLVTFGGRLNTPHGFTEGDFTVRIWDLSSANPGSTALILPIGNAQSIPRQNRVLVSPDGRWLATYAAGPIAPGATALAIAQLWDLSNDDLSASNMDLGGRRLDARPEQFSADSRWLIGEDADHNVILWDLTAADPAVMAARLSAVQAPSGTDQPSSLSCAAFSPDGGWLLTGYDFGVTRLWDIAGGLAAATPVDFDTQSGPVHTCAFSADSKWFLVGARNLGAAYPGAPADDRLLVGQVPSDHSPPALTDLSVTAERAGRTTPDPGFIGTFALAFSPQLHRLATGSPDGIVRLWDLAPSGPLAATTVLRGHDDAVTDISFSPNGRWLVSTSADGTARLWDLDVGAAIASPVPLDVSFRALSGNGRWLVFADRLDVPPSQGKAPQPALHLRDLQMGRVLQLETSSGTELAERTGQWLSSNGRWLIAAYQDRTIKIWDLSAADPTVSSRVVRGLPEPATDAAISSDGRWLVTQNGLKSAALWDLSQADPSANSLPLPSAQSSGRIVPNSRCISMDSSHIRFSADSHWLLIACGDRPATLWNLTAPVRGGPGYSFPAASALPQDFLFSSDSRSLLAAGKDSGVQVLDLKDAALTSVVILRDAKTSIIGPMSNDSRWLIVSGALPDRSSRRLCDVSVRSPVCTDLDPAPDALADQVSFSPNSRWLAVRLSNGQITLWNLSGRVPTPAATVSSGRPSTVGGLPISFSGDSRRMATGMEDGAVYVWDVGPSGTVAQPVIIRNHGSFITQILFSSDGHWMLTSGGAGPDYLHDLRLESLSNLACQTVGRNLFTGEWQQFIQDRRYRKTCPNQP